MLYIVAVLIFVDWSRKKNPLIKSIPQISKKCVTFVWYHHYSIIWYNDHIKSSMPALSDFIVGQCLYCFTPLSANACIVLLHCRPMHALEDFSVDQCLHSMAFQLLINVGIGWVTLRRATLQWPNACIERLLSLRVMQAFS